MMSWFATQRQEHFSSTKSLLGFFLRSALLASAIGCSEESSSADTAPLTPLEVRPGFYFAEGDQMTLLNDGDEVPVRLATQGGFVMFIGSRTTGLAPGTGAIKTELINPDTSAVFIVDQRQVLLTDSANEPDTVEPDASTTSNFSHLLPCPNYEERPVEGVDWILNVEMSDPDVPAHKGSTSVIVRPTCAPGIRHEQCVCECKPLYVFEKCGAPH